MTSFLGSYFVYLKHNCPALSLLCHFTQRRMLTADTCHRLGPPHRMGGERAMHRICHACEAGDTWVTAMELLARSPVRPFARSVVRLWC